MIEHDIFIIQHTKCLTEKEQSAIPRNKRCFDNAAEARNPLKLL